MDQFRCLGLTNPHSAHGIPFEHQRISRRRLSQRPRSCSRLAGRTLHTLIRHRRRHGATTIFGELLREQPHLSGQATPQSAGFLRCRAQRKRLPALRARSPNPAQGKLAELRRDHISLPFPSHQQLPTFVALWNCAAVATQEKLRANR
jgi:hypothetical protein